MNEIPTGYEQCEACGHVDVLAKMHVKKDAVICDGCNEAAIARVEAAAEDYEPETI